MRSDRPGTLYLRAYWKRPGWAFEVEKISGTCVSGRRYSPPFVEPVMVRVIRSTRLSASASFALAGPFATARRYEPTFLKPLTSSFRTSSCASFIPANSLEPASTRTRPSSPP